MPDAESPTVKIDFTGFSQKEVRLGFIRKVYGILMTQLSVTFGVMCIFLFVEPVKHYAQDPNNKWLYIVASVLTFLFLIVLAIGAPVFARHFPYNVILLTSFTALQGVVLGVVTGIFDTKYVLMAVGITMAMTLGLTIYAFQTRWDFTMLGGLLYALLQVLICFGILCGSFRTDFANIAYSCLGALLFSAYLVFDTQLLMGGDHNFSISPEDYIFAVLSLYLDIINLFLIVLVIVAAIAGKK